MFQSWLVPQITIELDKLSTQTTSPEQRLFGFFVFMQSTESVHICLPKELLNPLFTAR